MLIKLSCLFAPIYHTIMSLWISFCFWMCVIPDSVLFSWIKAPLFCSYVDCTLFASLSIKVIQLCCVPNYFACMVSIRSTFGWKFMSMLFFPVSLDHWYWSQIGLIISLEWKAWNSAMPCQRTEKIQKFMELKIIILLNSLRVIQRANYSNCSDKDISRKVSMRKMYRIKRAAVKEPLMSSKQVFEAAGAGSSRGLQLCIKLYSSHP